MNNYSPLLSYLKTTQLLDGSFENSPFQTSLILVCLAHLKNNIHVQIIARNAISYLFSQVSLQGSWNYLDRSDTKKQYPDDLDDTALALTAITIHAPHLITEDILLSFVHLLVSAEVREGGPYFTWLTPPNLREVWNDIDPVVNSNIHYFLGLHKIQLEPLENYLKTIIVEDQFSSKYYSPLHISFFLSKWKTNSKKKELMKRLVQIYPKITTLLDRALFVSAYLNLGGSPEKVYSDIERLSRIQPNHLDTDPFYIEEIENGITTYAGSKPLVAAHIIQAITTHETIVGTETQKTPEIRNHQMIKHVSHLALQQFSDAPSMVQKKIRVLVEKMASQKKSPEIFLLPFLWHESLHSKYQNYSKKQVLQLWVKKVLGWIGFSIYDDVVDGEKKQHLIPLANLCVREVSEIFQRITPSTAQNQFVKNTLQTIDYAAVWEKQMCHVPIAHKILEPPKTLPDYGNLHHLANKSLGHALGPIILTPSKKNNVQQFFIHYLIARQLNDDAHDLLTDLEQGFLNPVSVQVIKRLLELHPNQTHVNLESDRELLQSLFWHEVIDTIVVQIQDHLHHARTIIRKSHIFKDTSIIETLLAPLEESAQQALFERNRITRFLEKYH